MAQTPAQKQKAYRERLNGRALGIQAHVSKSNLPQLKRWRALLKNANTLITACRIEISDYISARSQAWQESDKAELFAEVVDAIDEIADSLQDIDL